MWLEIQHRTSGKADSKFNNIVTSPEQHCTPLTDIEEEEEEGEGKTEEEREEENDKGENE